MGGFTEANFELVDGNLAYRIASGLAVNRHEFVRLRQGPGNAKFAMFLDPR